MPVFVAANGKLTNRASNRNTIATVQQLAKQDMPVFKTKDLLQKTPDTLPLLQAQKDAQLAEIIAKNMNKKHSSAVDTGQEVTDIDIDELFIYFQKSNRKKIEKAFSGVKFERVLLTTNDRTGEMQEDEFPFQTTKRDMKLH